ncbi:hypothetical protein FS749_012157 [Ceratobasidium sp. UAMH 11750]|nr:hypothetical protein FS749_012157 [Ceratobasidium sp. UAMH 11750]
MRHTPEPPQQLYPQLPHLANPRFPIPSHSPPRAQPPNPLQHRSNRTANRQPKLQPKRPPRPMANFQTKTNLQPKIKIPHLLNASSTRFAVLPVTCVHQSTAYSSHPRAARATRVLSMAPAPTRGRAQLVRGMDSYMKVQRRIERA